MELVHHIEAPEVGAQHVKLQTEELVVIGVKVVGLYPNLDQEITAAAEDSEHQTRAWAEEDINHEEEGGDEGRVRSSLEIYGFSTKSELDFLHTFMS